MVWLVLELLLWQRQEEWEEGQLGGYQKQLAKRWWELGEGENSGGGEEGLDSEKRAWILAWRKSQKDFLASRMWDDSRISGLSNWKDGVATICDGENRGQGRPNNLEQERMLQSPQGKIWVVFLFCMFWEQLVFHFSWTK